MSCRVGSSFDDFLKEDGIFETVTERAKNGFARANAIAPRRSSKLQPIVIEIHSKTRRDLAPH
jgi:hypothetical protein